MQEKALSQGDLARLVCVSTPTVWGWIHESVPQQRTAEVLCQKLDVGRAWLIAGKGKRTPYFSKTQDPQRGDFWLSMLEAFEEMDLLTVRNEAEARVYKQIAKDLRTLARSLKKEATKSTLVSIIDLATRYEMGPPLESQKAAIKLRAKDLTRIQRAVGINPRKHLDPSGAA